MYNYIYMYVPNLIKTARMGMWNTRLAIEHLTYRTNKLNRC